MGKMRLASATFLLAAAILLASCGGSSGAPAMPSPSPTEAPASTRTPAAAPQTPTPDLLAGVPLPTSLETLTFVDPMHGWAIDTCSNVDIVAICDILATSDGGKTWHVQYRNVGRLQDLQFLDAQNGFASGKAEVFSIVATTDGGNTWTPRYPDNRFDLAAIQFVTPQHAFALASGAGVIFESADSGTTWAFNYGSPQCNFSSISFPTADEGWAAGGGADGPCLYQTTDGGKKWNKSFQGATDASVRDAFADFLGGSSTIPLSDLISHANQDCGWHTNIKFATADDGWLLVSCSSCFSGGFLILRTLDAGGKWGYVWGPTSCLMGCQTITGGRHPLFFLDADNVWRQGKIVQHSPDGGRTWSPNDESVECCESGPVFFVDAQHGWTLFNSGYIGTTTDGGLTWTVQAVTIEY